MVQKKFFVNSNNQLAGPFELEAIFRKVDSGELKATDYMYVEVNDDWVLICTHPDFVERLKDSKPAPLKNQSAPVPRSTGDTSAFGEKTVVAQATARPENQVKEQEADEWYVLKGQNRYGPFPYMDLLRMLQEKSVFEFDYVWKPGLDTWKRVAELKEFHADTVRKMISKDDMTNAQVFFRRRHERAQFECGLIVHDNNRVWRGKSVQISEGGAGIIMENAMLLPGQNIYLHFKPAAGSKPFNALCEIVSKRYVRGVRNKDTPLFYGIKFITVQKNDREVLKTIAKSA